MRFREIINEISDRVKQATRDRWQQEDENLTDQQIDYYLDRWDRFAKSFPEDKRDITQLSFADAENLIDAAQARQALRGKKKPKTTAQTDGAMPGHIYNKNNLVIYKGNSKPKCIQYGSDYTWCISRSDSSNLYNRYRFASDEPVFYFVFDKDLPKNDPWHAVVIYVTRDNDYMVAAANNPGDEEMTWQEISQEQPKLSQLQNLFKPEPPSAEEKADYQKYGKQVDSETYDNFSYQEKIKYIEFGNRLESNQEVELDSQLLSLYSKQNPRRLSVDSLNRLSPGDFRYLLKNANIFITDIEEIRQEVNSKKQKIVWEVITQTARYACDYAYHVIKGRFPAGEAAIAQDPEQAFIYARHMIRGRWPAGEAAIAQDPEWAYEYADLVIGGRFPAGEAAIAQDAGYAYRYARYVIGGRFPEGEAAIAQDPMAAFGYAAEVIGGRFPAGEAAIAQDPESAFLYARHVIEGRWPAGEAVIAQYARYAYAYARNVIKGRWPEPHRDTAEANIKKSANRWTEYMELVKQSENQ